MPIGSYIIHNALGTGGGLIKVGVSFKFASIQLGIFLDLDTSTKCKVTTTKKMFFKDLISSNLFI